MKTCVVCVFWLRSLFRIIELRVAVVATEVIGVSAEVGPLFVRTRTRSSATINWVVDRCWKCCCASRRTAIRNNYLPASVLPLRGGDGGLRVYYARRSACRSGAEVQNNLVVRLERTEGAGVRRYEGGGRRGERQRDMGHTRTNW